MNYTMLDKSGEEVRIPEFIRELLSPKLLMYQELYLGTKKFGIALHENKVIVKIYNDIGRLVSENEYTWSYWLKSDLVYVNAVNWIMDHDYILVGNEYEVK